MRIALVVDPLTVRTKGGSHAPGLAAELLGRGHVVGAFGSPTGAIPHSGTAALESDEEEDVARHLAGFAPDVVVAYDALSPAAWNGARTAKRSGAALVLVEGGLPRASIKLHERVLQGVGEALWGRTVREAASAVVALDPVARAKALSDGFDPQRISILPEGLDVHAFRPGLTSAFVSSKRIGGRILTYAGPLAPWRGLEPVLRAFARTVGQREDWTFVIAGDGMAAPRLRLLADRLGVGARVQFLPRLRTEELPGLLAASTLAAVPARDNRVRGRQAARALACGVPVLASDVQRLRYFVDHEESGLLVREGGEEAAWVDALQRACGAPEARRRWGERARVVATERFAWPAVAEAFEGILGEAVARERAA